MKLLCLLAVLLTGLGGPPLVAAPPVLVVTAGGATRQFTGELLVRHDPGRSEYPTGDRPK